MERALIKGKGSRMIKERVKLHPTAEIGEGVEIGDGTKIWAQAQLGAGARLGANCVVGKGAYIDRGVRVGNNVMIHNYALLYRPLTVEDNVFIGPQVANANDPTPIANVIRDTAKDPGTTFKKGCRIGMGATLAPNLTIGEYAQVDMRALVTRDVPPHAIVRGVPAKIVGFACFCGKKLGKHPEIQMGASIHHRCADSSCAKTVTIPLENYKRMK